MKCSACQLEIKENIKAHYASEIHKINTRRQIYNAPPITIEEITAEQLSDDVSLEINGLEDTGDIVKNIRRLKKNIISHENSPKETGCLFCESIESDYHYIEHGISAEEMVYIYSNVCYVCYEGFSTREDLRRHIISKKIEKEKTDISILIEVIRVIEEMPAQHVHIIKRLRYFIDKYPVVLHYLSEVLEIDSPELSNEQRVRAGEIEYQFGFLLNNS